MSFFGGTAYSAGGESETDYDFFAEPVLDDNDNGSFNVQYNAEVDTSIEEYNTQSTT